MSSYADKRYLLSYGFAPTMALRRQRSRKAFVVYQTSGISNPTRKRPPEGDRLWRETDTR
jgi:hypothetical protein